MTNIFVRNNVLMVMDLYVECQLPTLFEENDFKLLLPYIQS